MGRRRRLLVGLVLFITRASRDFEVTNENAINRFAAMISITFDTSLIGFQKHKSNINRFILGSEFLSTNESFPHPIPPYKDTVTPTINELSVHSHYARRPISLRPEHVCAPKDIARPLFPREEQWTKTRGLAARTVWSGWRTATCHAGRAWGRRAAGSTPASVCGRRRTGRPTAAGSLVARPPPARCPVSPPVGRATGSAGWRRRRSTTATGSCRRALHARVPKQQTCNTQ